MLKLSNRARSQLASGINEASASVVITSGHEGRFPALAPGEWFPLVVVDAANNYEIMRCTARAGVTLSVERAQEGTTARSFDAGASASVRLTAGALEEHTELPDRLKPTVPLLANADTLIETGPYRTDGSTVGRPADAAGYLHHAELTVAVAVQEWQHAGDEGVRYLRLRIASIWQDWHPLLLDRDMLDDRYLRKTIGGTLGGRLVTAASASGGAGLNITPGVAPDEPVSGDIWATAAGIFARVADSTWALARRGANTFIGRQVMPAATAEAAGLNLPHGVSPTDPVDGDLWTTEENGLLFCADGATRRVAHDGNVHSGAVWQAGTGIVPAMISPALLRSAIPPALAALAHHGIGSTCFLGRISGIVQQGEVYAGEELRFAGSSHVGTGGVPAGSMWLATGAALSGAATTFRRIL